MKELTHNILDQTMAKPFIFLKKMTKPKLAAAISSLLGFWDCYTCKYMSTNMLHYNTPPIGYIVQLGEFPGNITSTVQPKTRLMISQARAHAAPENL